MGEEENQLQLVDPRELDLSGLMDVAGTADRSEDTVDDSSSGDYFTQGRAAGGSAANPYSTRAALLKEQADHVSADAIATLNRALANQHDTGATPEQGLTAALLAAVPAIGGAMIGSSMKTKVPAGTFGAKIDPVGAGSIGMIGLDAGTKAAGGYLKSLQPSKEENDTLLRLAEYKNRQAQSWLGQAGQAEMAGLNAQQANSRQDRQFANQMAMEKYKLEHPEELNPAIRKAKVEDAIAIAAGKKEGIAGTPLTEKEKSNLIARLQQNAQRAGGVANAFAPLNAGNVQIQRIIQKPFAQRDAADSLAIAESAARALNPGAVLREGLYKALLEAMPVLEQYKGELQNTVSNHGQLSEPVQMMLAQMVNEKTRAVKEEYDAVLEPIKQTAIRYEIPIEQIVRPLPDFKNPQDEIAANNAKIAELKASLNQQQGLYGPRR